MVSVWRYKKLPLLLWFICYMELLVLIRGRAPIRIIGCENHCQLYGTEIYYFYLVRSSTIEIYLFWAFITFLHYIVWQQCTLSTKQIKPLVTFCIFSTVFIKLIWSLPLVRPCYKLLLSVYVAPPPAEVLHCSLCLDRLPVHSSLLFLVFFGGFCFFWWMLSQRLPSGLSNKSKVVQTREEDESDGGDTEADLYTV